MTFIPKKVAADVFIQVSSATTADVNGQSISVDTTAAAVSITLPDNAIDGAEFNIRWAAGANPVTVIPQTSANYKVVNEFGALVTSDSLPILGALLTYKFEQLTPTTGQFLRA
jgi:hypothetical protein